MGFGGSEIVSCEVGSNVTSNSSSRRKVQQKAEVLQVVTQRKRVRVAKGGKGGGGYTAHEGAAGDRKRRESSQTLNRKTGPVDPNPAKKRYSASSDATAFCVAKKDQHRRAQRTIEGLTHPRARLVPIVPLTPRDVRLFLLPLPGLFLIPVPLTPRLRPRALRRPTRVGRFERARDPAHLLLEQDGGGALSVEHGAVLRESEGAGAVRSAAAVVRGLGEDFLVEVEEDVDDGRLWEGVSEGDEERKGADGPKK